MLKQKSAAWIAFSVGFSILNPQIALASAPGIDCSRTSHPSCAPQALPKKVAKKSGTQSINSKIASYSRQIKAIDKKLAALDKKQKVARARTETLTKKYQPYLDKKLAAQYSAQSVALEAQLKIAQAETVIATDAYNKQKAISEQVASDIAAAREVREAYADRIHADMTKLEAREAELARSALEIQERQAQLEKESAETDAALLEIAKKPAEEIVKTDVLVIVTPPAVSPPAATPPAVTAAVEAPVEKKPVPVFAPGQMLQAIRGAGGAVSALSQIVATQQNRRSPSGADYTAEEARSAILDLTPRVDEKNSVVIFDGLIFASCQTLFEQNVRIEQTSVQDGEQRVGVRVMDPQKKFAKCMQAKLEQGSVCNDGTEDNRCVRISDLDTYREVIQLPKKIKGPIEIGIFTAQKNKLEDTLDFTPIQTYRTQSVIKSEKRAQDRAEAIKLSKQYSCDVTDCMQSGNISDARKACNALKSFEFMGALDPATKREIAEEYTKCSGELDEALLNELAQNLQEAKDAKDILKAVDKLASFARYSRKAANAIAEQILGKADALSHEQSAPSLNIAALTIPGLNTLGASSNPMAEAARSFKGVEDRLNLARALYKKGLTLGATKDWTALFNQKLTELDFKGCEARAQAFGLTDLGVQSCINQNYATAQQQVQENCADQYSAQCMSAVGLAQSVQMSYGVAAQKTQELQMKMQQLALEKQKAMMQQYMGTTSTNNIMGNGQGFMGLSGLNGTSLPTTISPNTGMAGLQNLGKPNLPGVTFN